MDRGLLILQDAIQKQETTSVCVEKTAGIGWNTLEPFVILRMTSYTPSPIVSAVFSKTHNSFTRLSKTSRTVLDVWTCFFKLQGMLVNSNASTMYSFPESVTLWLRYFNFNLYNEDCKERNAAYLLFESGIQFVPCSPFTVLECIQSIVGERWIDIHAALPRNCLYSPIQLSPAEEHRYSLSYSSLESECWFGLWKCLLCVCGVWFWRLQHSLRFPSRNHDVGVNLRPSR